MEDPVAEAILNQYFRRLEQALSGVPSERRTQIVEDLRAHVHESLGAEPDHSDATILRILDRLGDPDEIAREALADQGTEDPALRSAGVRQRPADVLRSRPLLAGAAAVVAAAAAVVVVVLSLTGGRSTGDPASQANTLASTHGLLIGFHNPAPTTRGGWLPSGDVSGGGGVDAFRCSPQTVSGSESIATLEAGSTQVGSGSVDGHSWSVWSKDGVQGGPGLEQGGVVIDGVAHGLCDGFPNPAEMEVVDPSGGGDAIAYGVVGYLGAARVDIYTSTAGTFDAEKLVGSATSQSLTVSVSSSRHCPGRGVTSRRWS